MKTNATRIIKATLYLFLVVTLIFGYSCSPEDGRDGSDGVDGIQGDQGIPGEDGSANIEVSAWFPIQFDYLDPIGEHGRMHIEISNTMEFIENGGIVMMYFKQWDPNTANFAITPLPYGTGLLQLYYIFGDMTNFYGVEGFAIFANYPEGDVTIIEDGDYSIQYVLIPGNSSKQAMDIISKPYEDVMDYLGIAYYH